MKLSKKITFALLLFLSAISVLADVSYDCECYDDTMQNKIKFQTYTQKDCTRGEIAKSQQITLDPILTDKVCPEKSLPGACKLTVTKIHIQNGCSVVGGAR